MIAVLLLLLAAFVCAEDFKTVSGKVYKDATISHVEADGIVLRTKTGISKVYFVELSKDVQQRFHYRATKASAPQREPESMNVAAKQENAPPADQDGLAGVLPGIPPLFAGLLKFLVAAVIVTIVVFAFVHNRL